MKLSLLLLIGTYRLREYLNCFILTKNDTKTQNLFLNYFQAFPFRPIIVIKDVTSTETKICHV